MMRAIPFSLKSKANESWKKGAEDFLLALYSGITAGWLREPRGAGVKAGSGACKVSVLSLQSLDRAFSICLKNLSHSPASLPKEALRQSFDNLLHMYGVGHRAGDFATTSQVRAGLASQMWRAEQAEASSEMQADSCTRSLVTCSLERW